jgi:hypothetical protein
VNRSRTRLDGLACSSIRTSVTNCSLQAENAAALWGQDLSVRPTKMRLMGKSRSVRRIVAPVVACLPVGVRIRTRIYPTATEAAKLTSVGAYLGSLYRAELVARIACGVLDPNARALWRARRKQAITAVSSSRWAGTVTRAVEDQYQLICRHGLSIGR